MKITPLEIRKKTFEKQMSGYDKEEVNAFLLSLSHEWEHALDLIKSLDIQLKKSELDVVKLRDVEASLYKTLKTAEDTGANMINQAKKSADLHMKETQMNADGLLNESKSKARSIIEEAEMRAKQILVGMEDELKELARVYKSLEDHRDSMLNELTNLSTVTLQRVQKVSDNLRHLDIESQLKDIRKNSLDALGNISTPKSRKVPLEHSQIPVTEDVIDEPENQSSASSEAEGSFFDNLD